MGEFQLLILAPNQSTPSQGYYSDLCHRIQLTLEQHIYIMRVHMCVDFS